MYQPPNKFILETDFNKILDNSNPTILTGALNSKNVLWNSTETNSKGTTLQKILDKINNTTALGPPTPTHFYLQGGLGDVLDIIIVKNLPNNIDLMSVHELNSDHISVTVDIQQSNAIRKVKTRQNTSSLKFKAILNNTNTNNNEMITIEDIDKEIEKKNTEIIQDIINASLKTETITYTNDKLPQHIKDLIKQKNKVAKEFAYTRNPTYRQDRNKLIQEIK